MEYNILQRKSHLPTTRHLTVKFYSVIVLILTLHTTDVLGSTLGAKCQHDMDCTDFIKGSSCSAQGYCECAPYFVQYNTTTCLSSQLLGGDCTLNEQCTMKVANSSCLDGACRCVEGFLQFRKHTCLGPATPGSVCYSHAHCQMFSTRTHCDFLIPNLFGRCQCTAPAKLKAGLCVDNTIEEPVAVTPTTTSTTPQPLKETELPLISESSEPEQFVVSSSSSDSAGSLAVTIATKVDTVNPELSTDSQENVSIEEQAWQDDKDLPSPTSKTPLETPAEPLTPAKVEQHQQLEATEASDAIELPHSSEDYPYKIEDDEADRQTQKPDSLLVDFPKVTTLPDDEEEDHNDEYGHVIDNTMNFDYEAAQAEMENHLEMESTEEEKTELEKHEQELDEAVTHQQDSQELSSVIESDQEQENSQKVAEIPQQVLNEPASEVNNVEQPAEHEEQEETNHDQEQEGGNNSATERNIEEIPNTEVPQTEDYKLEQLPEQQHEEVQAEQKPEHQPEQHLEEQENEEQESEQLYENNHEEQEHEQPHEVLYEANHQQTHTEQEHEPQQGPAVHDQKETELQNNDVHEEKVIDQEEEQESQQQQSEQILPIETDITLHDPKPEHEEDKEEIKVSEEEVDHEAVNDPASSSQQDLTNNELEAHPISDPHVHEGMEEHEEIPEETQPLTNEHEPEHAFNTHSEQEEDPEFINGQKPQHVSEIETHEQELENGETFDSTKESNVEQTHAIVESAHDQDFESHEANESKKESENEQTQEIIEPQLEHNPELDHEHENQQLEEVQQQIQDDKYLANEQQSENIEQSHVEESQSVDQQENVAQLDHTNPDNTEINSNLPNNQQQQPDHLDEESLGESSNQQSIANEMHDHDQNVAETESVQNENEATTQQQIPVAAEQPDDEITTTQPAKLEEQEEENNEELEEENSQEQQQPISDTTAKDDFLVNNDQHQITDKEAEKSDENITEGQIDTDTNTDEHRQEILQETTEKLPEDENHTEKFNEDINQHLSENFEAHQEDKQNESFNKQIAETNQMEPAFEEDEEKPNELEQESEHVTENRLQLEEEDEHLAENENSSQEEVSEIENTTAMPTDQHDLGELSENEEQHSAMEQENKDLNEMAETNSIERIDDQNEINHLESNGHQLMHETSNSNTDIKQEAPEINESSHIEHNSNEKEEDNGENEVSKLPLVSNGNDPIKFDEQDANENEDDNLIESTTLTAPDEIQEADSTENIETNKIEKKGEADTSEQITHLLTNKDEIPTEQPAATIHAAENEEDGDNISQLNQQEAHEEEIPSSIETNNVPSEVMENNEELIAASGHNDNDNEVIDKELQEYPTKNQLQNNQVISAVINQAEGGEESFADVQPDQTYVSPGHSNDFKKPENQEFKESESISDILNNLMKEDVTLQPEYAEEADIKEYLPDSDVADLLAEDTNISEESVLSHQLPSKDSTEATIDPEDKLITFYPDMQELQPVQQMPITSQQELEHEALEESSGDEAANEINKSGEHVPSEQHHTLSPLDIPFDTSVDYEPQQFEADNLIVETTTLAASELKSQDIEETVDVTTKSGVMDEVTTQTMLNLASRVTLMEPAAPVTTTLKPLMPLNTNEEVTAVPSFDAPIMEALLTTKPSTEIRKRVELSLEAVSLGVSCSNSEQCRLADPHTICNARGVCDCAANVYMTQDEKRAQCGAEKTGCAPGTFQCRSSGVCISWFFVCDGRSDCNDASDEECTFNARRNQTCPSQAFQCGQSGRCISRAALCDGHKQCPQGEDEIGCNALRAENSCPTNTFRCKSGECLPEYEYCNAIISCRDGSDEPPHLCGSRSMPNFFLQLLSAGGLMGKSADNSVYCPHRCSNGRCRSTAIVCSGRDGCGDGTDEQTCSVCKCPAVNVEIPAITVSEYLARHHSKSLW